MNTINGINMNAIKNIYDEKSSKDFLVFAVAMQFDGLADAMHFGKDYCTLKLRNELLIGNQYL